MESVPLWCHSKLDTNLEIATAVKFKAREISMSKSIPLFETKAHDALLGLARLFPPNSMVVCGSSLSRWSPILDNVPDARCLQITGDPPNNVMKGELSQPASVQLNCFLADREGRAIRYIANSHFLSGLTPPESLRQFWQNATTIEEVDVEVRKLDQVVQELVARSNSPIEPNWLTIDEICSGMILRGSEHLLASIDVAIIRTIRATPLNDDLSDHTLEAVTNTMSLRGFRLFQVIDHQHHAFEYAIFVLDWKNSAVVHAETLVEQVSELQGRLAETTTHLDEAGTLLEEKEELLNEASAELKEKEELLSEVESKLIELQKAVVDRDQKLDAQREEMTRMALGQLELSKSIDSLNHSFESVSQAVQDARYVQFSTASGSKTTRVKKILLRADRCYEASDFKRATEFYQLAANQDSNSAWALQGLAESIARLDYLQDPNWTLQERTEAIEEIGRWDVSVRLYRKALSKDKTIGVAFNDRFPTTAGNPANESGRSPIFVVGCGHSGTSIFTRMLGAHPAIMPIEKESALFIRSDDVIRSQLDEWDVACAESGALRWIEKTPPHVFQISRFMGFRPEAKFIVLIRDGRDVIASLKRRNGYELVRDRIDRWVYDNLAALQFVDHENVHFLKYEDLVTDPSGTLSQVCEFLGEKLNAQVLEYHSTPANWYSEKGGKPDQLDSNADHNQLRNWQINQPIFDGRGKWVESLTGNEKRSIKRSEAQKMLEYFEYVEGTDW